MKNILVSLILSSSALLIFLPSQVRADVPDPKFLSSKCEAGEQEIMCSTGQSLNPAADQLKNECEAYTNRVGYRQIYSDLRVQKYCYMPLSQTDRLLSYFKSASILILLTLLLEVPTYYIFGFKSKKNILQVVLINVLTVSGLFLVTTFSTYRGITPLLIMELLIVFIESVYLYMFNKKNTLEKILFASLIANSLSALLGGFILKLIT